MSGVGASSCPKGGSVWGGTWGPFGGMTGEEAELAQSDLRVAPRGGHVPRGHREPPMDF